MCGDRDRLYAPVGELDIEGLVLPDGSGATYRMARLIAHQREAARASRKACGRSRLPTCSARNGGMLKYAARRPSSTDRAGAA